MSTPQSHQPFDPSGDDHIDGEPLDDGDKADDTFCDDSDFMYFDEDDSEDEHSEHDDLLADDEDCDTPDDEHDKSRRRGRGRSLLSPWLMMGLLFEEEDP